MTTQPYPMTMSPEVEKALAEKRPVVALESTIISHGMPYPQNVEMARRTEDLLREGGATPATIAIIDGVIKIGLTDEELTILATAEDVTKVSRRDLPFVVGRPVMGATTVAATMILADLAGIRVFVTGGIGGVHRGAATSFDISSDLEELGKTNVAVVCAGAKSILDIGLTLEVLETKGVPVVGYGTDELPAFYTRESGYFVDYRVDSPEAVAKAMHTKWAMGLTGGLVIANPIPQEDAVPKAVIDGAIHTALVEAKNQGIVGKDVTPFLLARVKALTEGKSLAANLALVYNNARVGAAIAVSYSQH